MFPVRLVGRRVTLREVTTADAEAVGRVLGHPLVAERFPCEETPLRVPVGEPRAAYHLVVEKDAEVVGGGALRITSTTHGRGEICYVLHPDWWGQGLATETARLLVDLGLRDLGLHRIEATVDDDNGGAQRVCEKIGMRYEGRTRGYLQVGGVWRDSVRFATLAGDGG
ncbi:N-acetyltransferase GCN5 [Longispora fulva]|uniref:RimJ/RimL family protein N-acetyltransferase n=1 Tax=Longispora fulva TaxID=619741 RepID=A0A8J7KNP8_9ACTN|nr:GNAT family protein [Longispora fulva]MBG6135462.1 RimJ/RimL family protein N-acetyltransferase [Longispora fulva]GIG56296.1 N-acetyltransferase GCN5 [Longispora fulva]